MKYNLNESITIEHTEDENIIFRNEKEEELFKIDDNDQLEKLILILDKIENETFNKNLTIF